MVIPSSGSGASFASPPINFCGIWSHVNQAFLQRVNFDGEIEEDSDPDVNRTIAGPLGAKHAPVARHCHLGRVVDLFDQ
jgi:hypothetical protein